MGYKDILLTPIYLAVIYLLMYWYRRRASNPLTKPYFFPAFHLKVVGALAVGLIYQFYYRGGDTFNFFRDSSIIWEAFLDSPLLGFKVLLADQQYDAETYPYVSRIYFYQDGNTRPIIKISGFLGFFTFHTYSAIALLFALICFSGLWALYQSLIDMYPQLNRSLAVAVFFIPSVFFWGSGLLKDTITLGALGWSFHAIYFGLLKRKAIVRNVLILLLMILLIQSVKIYILLCFIPAVSLWFFLHYRSQMRSALLRLLLLPLAFVFALPIGYVAVNKLTEGSRYSLDQVANTARVTSEWLLYVSEKQGGSAYSLGELDGTLPNLLSKFPQAVWISLFRPYIWEARNPVMLLSALEALFFLWITLRVLWEVRFRFVSIVFAHPFIAFGLIFSVAFAFGTGVSSYNFGTLVRYKIPLMPFYLSAIYVLRYYNNRSKKLF